MARNGITDLAELRAHIAGTVRKESAQNDLVAGDLTDYVVESGIVRPVVDPRLLVRLPDLISSIGAVIERVTIECSKEGHKWVENFHHKCANAGCGTEYENLPENGLCEACGGSSFRAPDQTQLRYIRQLIAKPNPAGDTFKDLVRHALFYNLAIDDWFWEVTTDAIGRVVELWPLRSEQIRPAVEKDGRGRLGNREFFCARCRSLPGARDVPPLPPLSGPFDPRNPERSAPPCPACGGPTYETAYVQLSAEDKVVARWSEGEILHGNSCAYGNRLWGRSRLQSLWAIANVMRWLEVYPWQALSNNVSPDMDIIFQGMDQSAVNGMLAEVARFKRANPAARKYLMMGTGRGEEVEVKATKLMDPLKDLGGIDFYKLCREQVSIRYGVTLPFLGIPTPGRLGREEQQVEVSYDTVAEEQSQIEEFWAAFQRRFFPEVTDWHLELVHPQKDDLKKRAEVQKTVAETVETLKRAGATVEVTDDWDVKITGWGTPPPAPVPAMPGAAAPTPAATAPPAATARLGVLLRKDLSPRDIPLEDRVPGLRAAEDDFVKGLRAEHVRMVRELQRAAKSGVPEPELRDRARKATADLERRYREKVSGWTRSIYDLSARSEYEDPRKGARFEQRDQAAIDYLQQHPHGLLSAVTSFAAEETARMEGVIRDAYAEGGKFDLDAMTTRLGELVQGEDWQLERIARTETTRISNAGRRVQWEKHAAPEDRYEWSVAEDERTCPVCMGIADANPYSLDDLRRATKDGSPHPNCRCAWVRVAASVMETPPLER